MEKPVSDLDLDEDMRFQRWEWRLQRVGWILMALFVLAALLGAFGQGTLSRTMVERPTLRVDYERFLHRDAPSAVDITYRREGDTSLVLEFRRECIEAMELQQVRPQPKSTMAREGEGMSFEFELAPGAEWTKLHFLLKPAKPGIRHCEVRSDEDLQFMEFTQWIFP